jgi:hypothetical protein
VRPGGRRSKRAEGEGVKGCVAGQGRAEKRSRRWWLWEGEGVTEQAYKGLGCLFEPAGASECAPMGPAAARVRWARAACLVRFSADVGVARRRHRGCRAANDAVCTCVCSSEVISRQVCASGAAPGVRLADRHASREIEGQCGATPSCPTQHPVMLWPATSAQAKVKARCDAPSVLPFCEESWLQGPGGDDQACSVTLSAAWRGPRLGAAPSRAASVHKSSSEGGKARGSPEATQCSGY